MYIDDDLIGVYILKLIGIRLILLRLRFLYEFVYYVVGVYVVDEKKKGYWFNLFKFLFYVY